MKDKIVIRNLKQMRALSHPLRMRLLEAFSHEPVTTKQVADTLGEPPTRLYHHVEILKKAGLLVLAQRRKKRGTVEQYYQTAAHSFTVDRGLLEGKSGFRSTLSSMQVMITRVLEDTVKEVHESIEHRLINKKMKKSPVIVSHSSIWIPPDRIGDLNRKIRTLLKDYDRKRSIPGAVTYGFTLVLYPVRDMKEGAPATAR